MAASLASAVTKGGLFKGLPSLGLGWSWCP